MWEGHSIDVGIHTNDSKLGEAGCISSAGEVPYVSWVAMGEASPALSVHTPTLLSAHVSSTLSAPPSPLSCFHTLIHTQSDHAMQVSDFGLSIKMDQKDTHVSKVFQGTVSHMAPEILLEGIQSKASDV